MTDAHLLIVTIVLIMIPFACWTIIPYIKTLFPLVILQIAWGVILGPSVFGVVSPKLFDDLWDDSTRSSVSGIALYGILLFVFFTGLHLDKKLFFQKGTKKFWILGSVALFFPFSIAAVGGRMLLDGHNGISGPNGSKVTVPLALGISAGITALPICSAILVEQKQSGSALGKLVILCATLQDLVLWILLTFVLGLSSGGDAWAGDYQPLVTVGFAIGWVLFLFLVYNRALGWIVETAWWKRKLTKDTALVYMISGMCLSCLVTDAIGVHAALGAVLYGVALPAQVKHDVLEQIDALNRALFLPIFFGTAGLKVNLHDASAELFSVFALQMVAVLLGQVSSVLVCRYAFKMSWVSSTTVYSYLISKGIVEILVATVLVKKNVISELTYDALIMMALACTAMTKPLGMLIQFVTGDQNECYLLIPVGGEAMGSLPVVELELQEVEKAGREGGEVHDNVEDMIDGLGEVAEGRDKENGEVEVEKYDEEDEEEPTHVKT